MVSMDDGQDLVTIKGPAFVSFCTEMPELRAFFVDIQTWWFPALFRRCLPTCLTSGLPGACLELCTYDSLVTDH